MGGHVARIWENRCLERFNWDNLNERARLEIPEIDGRLTSKWSCKKWNGLLWTILVWAWIEVSGGLLLKRQ
jgi:hypothetical protein